MSAAKQAIVIGTGAGGLAAAAYLARYGFRVTALERSRQLGGYLNAFSRKRYRFDPGVHYLGECGRDQLVGRVLGGVGIDADELFCELDPDGFDVYRFPDLEIRLCKGLPAYRDRLAAQFPAEVRGLDRFFAAVEEVGQIMKLMFALMRRRPRLADLAHAGRLPFALRWATASYADFLSWITADGRLRAVLGANLGTLGVAPSQASVLLALSLFRHYQEGAYFPRGGGVGLRDALVGAAERNGATFRTKAEVKRITLRDGVARGVVLADGEQLEADAVISAVEPQVTYGRLIDLGALPWRLCRKVAYTEPSLGSLYVFLGLRRDLTEHGFGAFNVWSYRTYDLDGLYTRAQQGRLGDPQAFIASPNSLKDPSGTLAPQGCSTLEIMTFAPYEPFSRWDGLRSERRGPAYEELKQRSGEELLAAFEEAHPGVVGDVEVKTFATPVTNSYWVGAVKGGAYGPAMTRAQTFHRRFPTKTPFAGLYLAGSGVLGCGVALCLLSGKLAAQLAAKQLRTTKINR